jgi:hypothetical protein
MGLIGDVLRGEGVARLPFQRNPRCTLTYHIADLIAGWDHYGTNRRHTLLDTRLLFDAPPMGILVAGCILELARI